MAAAVRALLPSELAKRRAQLRRMALQNDDLSPSAILLLDRLLNYPSVKPEGCAYPTVEKLGNPGSGKKISRRSVYNGLAELVGLGWSSDYAVVAATRH
jgi:hypothetical protein